MMSRASFSFAGCFYCPLMFLSVANFSFPHTVKRIAAKNVNVVFVGGFFLFFIFFIFFIFFLFF